MGAITNALKRAKDSATHNTEEFEDTEPRSRWRSVTINRPQEAVVSEGKLPAPLLALGDLIEVQVRPAPGGKGAELAARLRVPDPENKDSVQDVRAALRESKQLIEVGEVLKVDPVPHGHRKATPGGNLVERATGKANKEGVL